MIKLTTNIFPTIYRQLVYVGQHAMYCLHRSLWNIGTLLVRYTYLNISIFVICKKCLCSLTISNVIDKHVQCNNYAVQMILADGGQMDKVVVLGCKGHRTHGRIVG